MYLVPPDVKSLDYEIYPTPATSCMPLSSSISSMILYPTPLTVESNDQAILAIVPETDSTPPLATKAVSPISNIPFIEKPSPSPVTLTPPLLRYRLSLHILQRSSFQQTLPMT